VVGETVGETVVEASSVESVVEETGVGLDAATSRDVVVGGTMGMLLDFARGFGVGFALPSSSVDVTTAASFAFLIDKAAVLVLAGLNRFN